MLREGHKAADLEADKLWGIKCAMKRFVLGAPCAGKSTIVRHFRRKYGLNALDADDEIVRLNGGVWPDIERPRTT